MEQRYREGEFLPAVRIEKEHRKHEWARYYSPKRVHEQLLQVQILKGCRIDTVLEIGPYYGLVTAMLDNAGYEVTTLDMIERSFERPARPHIVMDLTRIDRDKIRGFDCVMCCATLEHIHYEEATEALRAFREVGTRYAAIAVPYMGFQLFFRLYLNRYTVQEHFSLKKFRGLRTYRFDAVADPYGHKWEIGFRGRSLKRYEKNLTDLGWRIVRREFSYPSFSVFHLLENPDWTPKPTRVSGAARKTRRKNHPASRTGA